MSEPVPTDPEPDIDVSVDPGGAAAGEVPNALRLAAAVLLLQALGLVVAAAVLVVKTVVGDPDSIGRSLFGAAMAVLTALVLVGCARGLMRLRPAARTPIVVLELLALPVAYSLAFQSGRIGYGAPILLSALGILYLLFTPPAREALDREM
ncbi:hypothetical protein SAMN05892883_2543 [Jatrophihabitans sp. GAS493]|uniref:hypothetical protein n=1 Tax=Jatrophihabitans sp. GAS493 TaxID=1907575 RepID=UPI000BBF55A2|nr:hypothetical protein [Jatrophihabitans sp. GAS493]SOD73253.1 hypothetical protein SAMN05892883_2543 [Jatrophihabitans sp. GAS493]